jgi:hypothetical protein
METIRVYILDKNKFWCRFSRLLPVKSMILSKSKPFRNSAFLSYCNPHGNAIQCNCQTLKFLKWLFETHVTLDNNGNYSCIYIDGSRKTTSYVYQNTHLLTVECASTFWLIFSVCMTALLIFIIIVMVRNEGIVFVVLELVV